MMMPRVLKGFWKLTWVETKIFVREPMGLLGTLGIPVLLFVVLGRTLRGVPSAAGPTASTITPSFNVAILAALMIAVNAVTSLVAIISIYREGGILKRLRATPLSPLTILGAQVAVKLVFTVVSLLLLVAAGRRVFPGAMEIAYVSFGAALLVSTLSILSLGFIIASVVPTARFAQPIGAALLYPMVAVSGVFVPVARFPRWMQMVANALPTTHAVALLQGVWDGPGWSAHWIDVAALVLAFVVCSMLATRWFRWE